MFKKVLLSAALVCLLLVFWSCRCQDIMDPAARQRQLEARGLLADIKQMQESYRSEFGMYCDVNSPAPRATPTEEPTRWDGKAVNARWRTLGFAPDAENVYYVLDTIAGTGGDDERLRRWESEGVVLPAARADFAKKGWFVARAIGDVDGDGRRSLFWVTHLSGEALFRYPEE